MEEIDMLIELKSLREECGGCPTMYSGQTTNGKTFNARLRNGSMSIEIGEHKIVNQNVSPLDGVCDFSDFKRVARANGFSLGFVHHEFTTRRHRKISKNDTKQTKLISWKT
jgi:hypothetical protein